MAGFSECPSLKGFVHFWTLTLDREVERAEFTELHLLTLEQLLKHTVLELVGHTEADILTIDGVVLRHVLTEFLIGHGLGVRHMSEPLPEGFRVLDLVLGYFN